MSAAEVREAAESLMRAIGEAGAGSERGMRENIPPALWEPIIDLAAALGDLDSVAEYRAIFGDEDDDGEREREDYEAMGLRFCERHGGEHGEDPTCTYCTDEDGNPRP